MASWSRVTLLLFLSGLCGLLTWGIAALVTELGHLNDDLPDLMTRGEAVLQGLLQSVSNLQRNLPEGRPCHVGRWRR